MVNIEVVKSDRVTLVKAAGRVDSTTAPQLGDALTNQLNAGQYQIVIDLADVDYMSSAGLRELVNAYRDAKKAAGDIRLVRPSHRVQQILEMAGLDTIFQIFGRVEDAVASF